MSKTLSPCCFAECREVGPHHDRRQECSRCWKQVAYRDGLILTKGRTIQAFRSLIVILGSMTFGTDHAKQVAELSKEMEDGLRNGE